MDSYEYTLEEYKKCIRNIHSLDNTDLNRCIFLWNKLIHTFKEREKKINESKQSK